MKPIQHAACLCALSALLALSPAVALCENTPAENQQAEDSQLQTGKQANLRKLPNKKSDKLETLKKGSVLTVISVSEINGENWAYVRVQSGREGYILYELLEPVPTPTPEPGSETPAPTAEPSGVKDEIAYDEPRLVRTLKRANLRKKPAGSRLGEIAANTALTEQQAAEQAQAVVTEAARKAYLQATADLDAYARAQSSKYTTADLHLTSLAFRCPLDSYGRITTQFGEADPWGIPHRGTDFAAPGGTPVYAIADGIVSAAAAVYSYGNCVQISHGTADDGNTYDSLYAHLSSIAVSQGSAVTKGQVIGYVGNTGNVYSTGGGGYHLHLELRVNRARVNPLAYVPQ